MDLSIFFAKVMGFYLIIVSVALLTRREQTKAAIIQVIKSPGLTLISGIIALIFGLLVVVAHNIWIDGWPVFVTLLGWLMVVKGILRIALPDVAARLGTKLIEDNKAFYVTMAVTLLLGIYLTYVGSVV